MGRPNGTGLQYFSMECSFFSDKKTKLIKAEFGAVGMMVLIYTLTQIYSDQGYYLVFDDDEAMLIADEIGCGIEASFVKEVIAGCIRRKIFDESIFNAYGVLTSRGIQRRFLQAAQNRTRVIFIPAYFLLTQDYLDSCSITDKVAAKITINGVSWKETGVSVKETVVSVKESTQRKRKEKEKEIEKEIKENFEENNCEKNEATTSPVANTTVQRYALENLCFMSPRAMEELESFCEDMSDDIIRFAIDEAVDNAKRNWAYVRSILNAYLDSGYKSVGDIKAAQDARRNRKTLTVQKADDGEKVIWRD